MNKKEKIDELIVKFISGNATSEEIQKLENWKNFSEENSLLFESSKKVWEKAEGYIPEMALQKDKLKLAGAYNHYLSRRIQKINRYSFIYKMAAILAFPVALAIGWYLFGKTAWKTSADENYCMISSPTGHISKCILPDETEVWINTGSSIKYNVTTFNKGQREIELEGEAFFKVHSIKEKSFTVVTPYADVLVTGTSFNVNAYPSSDSFDAVLVEGKIQLDLKSGTEKTFEIKPGQKISFDTEKNSVNIESVDTELFTSWRNGEIIFKDATLGDLVKELERIYGIKFRLQPSGLESLRFRGMFSYDNNLIEALEKIKKSAGVSYYIENKEVWIRKNN